MGGNTRMPVSLRTGFRLAVTTLAGLVTACGNTVDVRVSATDEAAPSQVGPVTGNGAATLSWLPPTLNTDGSPLVDLTGYRVYAGRTPTALSLALRIDSPGVTVVVVDGLPSGAHYFAVSAIAASGSESALSSVGRKLVP
jgi:hypothetical protein